MKGFGDLYKSKKVSNKKNTLEFQALVNKAIKFHTEGNISEAAKLYEFFIKKGFLQPSLLSNYAAILKDEGKFKEAEEIARKSISIKFDNSDAHNNLGTILEDQGKFDVAKESFLKAISFKSDNYLAHYNLGNLLAKTGELIEAEKIINKTIDIKPDFIPALKRREFIIRKLLETKTNALNRKVITFKDAPNGSSYSSQQKKRTFKKQREDNAFSEIKIFCATKGKKEDCTLFKSIEGKNYEDIFFFKENNSRSLHKIYNEILKDCRDKKISTIVLMHDDVYINCEDFLKRVEESAKKFSIFGVAGAKSCRLGKPALWHLMSQPNERRGEVAHGSILDNYNTVFGPMNERVVMIDGVFIGINMDNLPPSCNFDENYPSKFHFYDLDFSLECNKQNLSIGVVNIPIIHESIGLMSQSELFLKGQDYFLKKWQRD